MRVVEKTEVLWLRSIGNIDLTRFDSKVGLTQTSALDKLIDYVAISRAL